MGFTTCALTAQTEPKIAPPSSPTLFSLCASFSQIIGQDLVLLRGARCDDYSLHCGPIIVQFSQEGRSTPRSSRQQYCTAKEECGGRGVLPVRPARHYWSRSRIGGRGREAVLLLLLLLFLWPSLSPRVCRSNALWTTADHALVSWRGLGVYCHNAPHLFQIRNGQKMGSSPPPPSALPASVIRHMPE